jgi:hypothetical protein
MAIIGYFITIKNKFIMELFEIKNDIEVVYLQAPIFPNDVPATYVKLNSLLSENPQRRYFGISHSDITGTIQYKAAAEILPDDVFTNAELQNFTLEKGNFTAEYIVNHFQDSKCIGSAFERLLQHPQLDPNGYCLEIYKNYTNIDVHCMVRILP